MMTYNETLDVLTDYRKVAYDQSRWFLQRWQEERNGEDLAAAKFWSREEDAYDNLICILTGTHPLSEPVQVIVDECDEEPTT